MPAKRKFLEEDHSEDPAEVMQREAEQASHLADILAASIGDDAAASTQRSDPTPSRPTSPLSAIVASDAAARDLQLKVSSLAAEVAWTKDIVAQIAQAIPERASA